MQQQQRHHDCAFCDQPATWFCPCGSPHGYCQAHTRGVQGRPHVCFVCHTHRGRDCCLLKTSCCGKYFCAPYGHGRVDMVEVEDGTRVQWFCSDCNPNVG